MINEYYSIMNNDVWEMVSRPERKFVMTPKWIYKIKLFADGSIEKHKAIFMAWGFSQKEGIDYKQTFTPTATHTSIRYILALAAIM